MNSNKLKDMFVISGRYISDRMHGITIDILGWLAAVVLHCSTIPGLLALLYGYSDKPIATDIALFVYFALSLLFIKSVLNKNVLTVVTISVGFIIQTVIMSLILFK